MMLARTESIDATWLTPSNYTWQIVPSHMKAVFEQVSLTKFSTFSYLRGLRSSSDLQPPKEMKDETKFFHLYNSTSADDFQPPYGVRYLIFQRLRHIWKEMRWVRVGYMSFTAC